jgi:superfamily II DNA or RNA helicase
MKNYHNIYISTNPDRKKLGKSKYGYVNGNNQNLANRLSDSREQFSDISEFTHIYGFEKTDIYNDDYTVIDGLISYGCRDKDIIELLERTYNTTLPHMRELSPYLVEGTNRYNEFITNEGIPILIKALKEDFPKLGLQLVNEYSQEEIEEIKNMGREKVKKEYEEAKKKYKTKIRDLKLSRRKQSTLPWDERQYQQEIIELGNKTLRDCRHLYLELATGGGKSFIVYKLLARIQSDTIIIFAPRKKINCQNGNKRYLSILGGKYHTFNYSTDTNLEDWLSIHKDDKKIIIACTQSQEKIYHSIKENNLSNISIWFDEAHWSIESWIDCKDSRSKQFFIQNTDRIKKRIYTSASPDKEKIELHRDIFGELYCPIKVKELIDLKWLCPIKPRILEYDTETLNLSDWVLEEFTTTDSHFGFSFHSRDNNAFQLFYEHYQTYKDENTTIKPYLLIDNGGLSDENKKLLETIVLDYDFRNDIDFEGNEKSIGYVCKRYDMGYDFAKLDYLVFSDPKMSRQDIIQCIGRGTRPDGLGENGQNLHKILNIMLPVYIGEDEGSYKNIIEVLRYLVLDLDVDILEDFIHNGVSVSLSDKKGKGVEYSGEENKSKLLDLIYQRNILERPTAKILYRFCRKYEIRTEEAYNRFKQLNPSIPLKANIYEYNGFKWQNVMDPNGEIYYREEGEIEKAEDQIIGKIDDEELEEFYAEREENGWIVLNRYDPKIPPMKIGQLEHYY